MSPAARRGGACYVAPNTQMKTGMMSMMMSINHHTCRYPKKVAAQEDTMQRVTITLDDELMEQLDAMIVEHGYQNRSEAIRDFVRAGIQQATLERGKSGECVAALVYVYDHAARDLSRRLIENYHGHHDMSLA